MKNLLGKVTRKPAHLSLPLPTFSHGKDEEKEREERRKGQMDDIPSLVILFPFHLFISSRISSPFLE